MHGARRELDSLFKCYRKPLIWKMFGIVSCRETAEDLVNEAYVRIATMLGHRSVEHMPTFLYQTAHNLAIDHLRREQTKGRFVDVRGGDTAMSHVASTEASPETVAADRQRLGRLEETLSVLPKRTRTVLLLNRIEGLSYPEIAKRLGVSQSTVYKDVRMALSHCLDILDED